MSGWVAGAVAVSSLVGAKASSSAASKQADAANRATDVQNAQYEQTRQDQMPWLEAGKTALNKLIPLTDYQKFDMSKFEADPGYGFRLDEGMKALERSAAARGGLLSGATGKNLLRYGQQMGSQEYQNAFNRYQAERAAQLQPLQSLAGVGQSAANTLGTTGANYANSVGNLMTSGAAAQAAGQVGTANAINSGLGTYLNYNQGNNLVNALNQNRAGYGGNYGGNYGSNTMPTVAPSYAVGSDWSMGGTWAP
jgi:hypothetical protein